MWRDITFSSLRGGIVLMVMVDFARIALWHITSYHSQLIDGFC